MRASWPGLHHNTFSGQHRRPVFKQPPVAKFITTKRKIFNRSTTSSMTKTQHSKHKLFTAASSAPQNTTDCTKRWCGLSFMTFVFVFWRFWAPFLSRALTLTRFDTHGSRVFAGPHFVWGKIDLSLHGCMGVRDYPCFSSFCGFEGREGDGRTVRGVVT